MLLNNIPFDLHFSSDEISVAKTYSADNRAQKQLRRCLAAKLHTYLVAGKSKTEMVMAGFPSKNPPEHEIFPS